ncbi:BamA/TamA family outer membrane protein [Pedobacter sp. MC2016-14]|uniref:BamA/TamA family outer membrane protein n=1 Tax=Pedobacter sp. MC2016-14 TaxID=2897327 RepID=UPI001E432A89|nr:BamA/TamA family outer membrane protein [Pedobacter sp. MC2016-14]MCD0488673.1 BamA/TamA family outer membrane protein [Pedobacter sp. MC2016-14]
MKFRNVICGIVLALTVPGLASAQYMPADSITVAIAPEYDQVTSLHRDFLGENYRKLWATPVKMRVLNLQKERGGLTIVKLGGGNQTRSIRFKDAGGKEWVLRTIQKYPERALPENLRATIAKNIVQDQVSTGHPFGALVVPPLADALHLPHANPEIVYVGDDPGLMEHRKDFANSAYLFEERALAETDDTDNTEKVQRKLQEDNDHLTDQKLVLRARLLDFIVGDWDRHEDNWRWLPEKKDGVTLYTPIPRDRDKVFYKTSGIFPWVLSHQWLKSNLQPYSENIRDIKGWNFNARYFDRYFLNGLNEQDWKKEISYVQEHISTALIQKAIALMPEVILKQNGAEVTVSLTGRLRNLEEIALAYYRFLAHTVEIPASDEREKFMLRHKDDGDIELTIKNIKKDGTTGRTIYHRTFKQGLTKEIRLYGFAGEDVFEVTGQKPSKIKVRMVGGDDVDEFSVDSQLKNKSRQYVYDRSDEENKFPAPGSVKLKLSTDTTVNQYNKKSFVFDQFGPLFQLNYNIDQGLQLGAGLIWQKQGFRKEPYAFKQEFWTHYSTGRKSFILTYAADFKKAVGENDLKIDANLLGPNNLSNFFGFGNETAFGDADNKGNSGISYYRNRYDYLRADVKLSRLIASDLRLEAGVASSYYTSSSNGNAKRFLKEFDTSNPDEAVFADRIYGGLVSILTYDTRNNISMPKKGVFWKTSVTGQKQVNGNHDTYGAAHTEFRFYLNPGNSGFIIANRVGAGTTFGKPTFYQKMQLGGVHTLRGFHTNRFTGKSMLYNNLDLRVKLFDFTSYITPGTVGIVGFNDVGRVWEQGQSSNTWHYGYGGGLYVVPAELILIQAVVGASKEGALPYISLGFNF